MSDDVRGLVGDRRKTPVPGFTEEQSWAMDVVAERAARKVLAEFASNGCPFPCPRMDSVHAVVFGRSEAGVVGLDQRVATIERTVNTWDDDRKWFKRMLYGALTVATIGLLVAIAQVVVLGR